MSDHSRRTSLPPFPAGYRASGVLLHVTSLPSPYGIGDVGPAALEWVDRLHEAGQRWWQALPLGPTGYGDSPYQPQSSFAGNVLLISPDWLIEDGLLRPSDCGGSAILGNGCRLRRRDPVQAPGARNRVGQLPRRGASRPARALCRVLRRARALARGLRPVPGPQGEIRQGATTSSGRPSSSSACPPPSRRPAEI